MFSKIWSNYYEGEENDGSSKAEEEKRKQEEEQRKKEGKLLTQEQFNAALAEDRRKHNERYQKMAEELERIKNKSTTSEKEKEKYQAQIADLEKQYLTREELAKKEQEKINNQVKKEKEELITDRDKWKNLYTETSIENSIMAAANTHGAHRAQQIVALLKPKTRIVEITDDEGSGTGKYKPMAKVMSFDKKDNTHKELELDISDAVKLMKDQPEEYGNLFTSTLNNGVGGSSGSSGGTKKSGFQANMGYEAYKKYKKENSQNY